MVSVLIAHGPAAMRYANTASHYALSSMDWRRAPRYTCYGFIICRRNHKMKNGRVLWDELCYRYDAGGAAGA